MIDAAAGSLVVAARRASSGPSRDGSPEHRVDQPRAAGARPLDQLDALVDGGMRADRVEVQQLEEPDSERREHRRLELGERPAHELAGDVVERAGAAGRSRRRSASRARGRAGRGRRAAPPRRTPGRRTPPARTRGGRRRTRTRAPGSPASPRSQSSPLISRRPGGLTTSSSSAPSAQPSTGRGPSSASSPGGSPTSSTRARSTPSGVPSSSASCAPMWGSAPAPPARARAPGRARVEPPVLRADLLGVRRQRVVLLGARRRLGEGRDQQLPAELGKPRGERPVRVLGADRLGLPERTPDRCRAPRSRA